MEKCFSLIFESAKSSFTAVPIPWKKHPLKRSPLPAPHWKNPSDAHGQTFVVCFSERRYHLPERSEIRLHCKVRCFARPHAANTRPWAHGRRKMRQGDLSPVSPPWILKCAVFAINVLVEQCFSLRFELVKLNFTTVALPWKIILPSPMLRQTMSGVWRLYKIDVASANHRTTSGRIQSLGRCPFHGEDVWYQIWGIAAR